MGGAYRRCSINLTRRTVTLAGLSLIASTGMNSARADWGELNFGEGLEDFWLATNAYIYGYPLVTMEMTRRVITNAARPEGTHAPMGQLIKLREYPNASFRDVTAPNADTLYITARRRRQRALGVEHSRHARSLLLDDDARRMDERISGSWQANNGDGRAEL